MLPIPALILLSLLAVARLTYPHPEEMNDIPTNLEAKDLPYAFWLYLVGAVFVAIGFADFPFMAYHLEKMSIVSTSMIPIFYAVAMGMSGLGSLLFGRLFDSVGIIILVSLTISLCPVCSISVSRRLLGSTHRNCTMVSGHGNP
jgi:predicted MFS family arabinose efflux permease